MRWLDVLFVLLVNAVPLVGVKVFGWSASSVVVLYWLENLMLAVFTSARIALHRTLTRKRGHWRAGQLGTKVGDKPSTAGLLGEYATMAFVFTLVHGIFVAGFTLIAHDHHPDDPLWSVSRTQLAQGAGWILVAMLMQFLVDVATLRQRSFAWLRAYVDARLGRVIVLHLALIFGMWGMLATASPFAVLYVLIGLKTLWDVAAAISGSATRRPQEPPEWALKLGAKQHGRSLAAQRAEWQRGVEAQQRSASEDEEVMPAQ